jgi:hypothetical protein
MTTTINVGSQSLPARVCQVCPGNAKIMLAHWKAHQERHRWRALFKKWVLAQTASLLALHQCGSDSSQLSHEEL